MNLKLVTICSLLLLVAAAGCAGADSSASGTGTGLLKLKDMPAGTVSRKTLDPDKACGPLPLLRPGAEVVRRTPSFKSGQLYVQESVALFPDESDAERAYAALTDRARSECIISNAQFSSTVLDIQVTQGDSGDREHALILEVEKDNKRVESQVSTILQGRAVGALLLIAKPAPLSKPEVAQLLAVAAERMSEAISP